MLPEPARPNLTARHVAAELIIALRLQYRREPDRPLKHRVAPLNRRQRADRAAPRQPASDRPVCYAARQSVRCRREDPRVHPSDDATDLEPHLCGDCLDLAAQYRGDTDFLRSAHVSADQRIDTSADTGAESRSYKSASDCGSLSGVAIVLFHAASHKAAEQCARRCAAYQSVPQRVPCLWGTNGLSLGRQ